MKLSKLFHWLYAALMFLPLLLIPIFAIYTRNESNTFENNIELQVPQNQVVEYNEILQNNHTPFTTSEYWSKTTNVLANFTNGNTVLNFYESENESYYLQMRLPRVLNHKYYAKVTYFNFQSTNELNIRLYLGGLGNFATNVGQNTFEYISTANNTANDSNFGFYASSVTSNVQIAFSAFSVIDLTQMFGVGNEPTIEQFNAIYGADYYEYNTGEKQLLKGVSTQTLNNTDIGSQFLYSVYKPVNDYFNIKDWMNLDGLFDWFLLNIFNGSNSIVIPIIFNLIVYWLVVSFIWLIFDVLMYVPNMIHKMLDKARLE